MTPDAPLQLAPHDGGGLVRRARLAVALVMIVLAGLFVSRLWHGPVSGVVGDGLYAVMVYLLVAFVVPKARAATVGGVAFGLCVMIELTQLTGVSAAVVQVWWPARYVLGTTFQAVDLVAYAVGALSAAVLDRAVSHPSR
jgi:Protein of unknown function (DUF2809)